MKKLHIIAIESPLVISLQGFNYVNACIYKNKNIYLYNKYGELVSKHDYKQYIDTLDYAVKEGRYDWMDFHIYSGEIITRDWEGNIYVDGIKVDTFSKPDNQCKGQVSYKTLKLFNQFLQYINKDNPEMIEALKTTLQDGYFRQQIKEIIKNDLIEDLSPLDMEIIVRTKIEGSSYVEKYVESMLKSTHPDKYVDINYFFRKVFNLEIYGYISLENL